VELFSEMTRLGYGGTMEEGALCFPRQSSLVTAVIGLAIGYSLLPCRMNQTIHSLGNRIQSHPPFTLYSTFAILGQYLGGELRGRRCVPVESPQNPSILWANFGGTEACLRGSSAPWTRLTRNSQDTRPGAGRYFASTRHGVRLAPMGPQTRRDNQPHTSLPIPPAAT